MIPPSALSMWQQHCTARIAPGLPENIRRIRSVLVRQKCGSTPTVQVHAPRGCPQESLRARSLWSNLRPAAPTERADACSAWPIDADDGGARLRSRIREAPLSKNPSPRGACWRDRCSTAATLGSDQGISSAALSLFRQQLARMDGRDCGRAHTLEECVGKGVSAYRCDRFAIRSGELRRGEDVDCSPNGPEFS